MNKTIKRDLSVDNLKPGMKILAPIMDREGKVLLPANIILTDKHLERVKMFIGADLSTRIPAEETISIIPEEEKRKTELRNMINILFAEYEDSKLHQYLKNMSIKTMEFLFDKNRELYE